MQPRHFLLLRRVAGLFLCALLLLNVTVIAEGQSGRRPPKRPTSPDPLPPAQSEPPISKPSVESEKSAIPILIARHLQDIAFSSDYYLRAVMDGFLERMGRNKMVKATPAPKELNRKEAQDAAKVSKDTYVVWFQLSSDNIASNRSDYEYGYSLYIDYVLYSPTTGERKSSGHIYQRQNRRGVPLPTPRSGSGGAVEYTLRYAGVEFAERVLDSLNLLTTPPIHN